ncbi:penicillin-binding transpeptidase domain-containing protein [Porphyromonas sp.]|uniref:penicillin-binding transpeptidase domain-containing protein n=1 Tax=Porphyromonas sp. TaxID=1924944 RepID=UPI0026DD1830|nr:penicillin-binding transpeptidase domain-containing protein [Porphyromonas sp.]MDO4770626.1 penicillin-binding transpeptidase domain-containing protein [Porphyromonas sp.]
MESQREKDRKLEILTERSKFASIAYMLIGVVVVLSAIVVFVSTFGVAVTSAGYWRELDTQSRLPDAYAPASRGNIYSDNGTALAISIPKYTVRMDFGAKGIVDSTFMNNLDALAKELSNYFGNKSKATYKNELLSAYKAKKRAYRLLPFEITHTQLKALKQMPFLSIPNRNKSGMVVEMVVRREKPFNTMASRTIGNLEQDVDSLKRTHGSSGLELAFDSLLCGTPGVDMRRYIGGTTIRIAKVSPIDGVDVHTTINVGIQDITERSLREMLVEVDADWGCAIVMDVKTGEIKALSNLDRIREGVYAEKTNHALADLLEPGSTIKVPSIMAALEEGSCSPSDSIETGNGLYNYGGRVVRDHNAHKGGYGRISVAQSIHYSSNVGVVKTILKAFEKDKKKFIEHLDKMSLFEPIELEIPGTAKARIQRDVSRWSRTSMAWMSFGYESMVPPIYICRFYNAIANDGKMMEPFIVSAIKDKNKVISEHKPKVVNKKIASSKTIKQMKEMLRGVVTSGTGKDADSKHVDIAGKTGTAQRSSGAGGYGNAGHNVSFCGFFPYEKPKYTCMVTVSRPRNGYPSGGRIAGGVVRNIAEQIFATTMSMDIKELTPDSTAHFNIAIHGGSRAAVKHASDISGVSLHNSSGSGDWFSVNQNAEQRKGLNDFNAFDPEKGVVPNLLGVSSTDAIFIAERAGLKVSITGHGGAVAQQSLRAGQTFSGHPIITLRLH